MNISKQEEADLKKLAAEFQIGYSELLAAYKETSQSFDDYKKIDEAKEFEKNKQQVDEMTKRILNLKKESKDDDSVEEQIEDVEEIQKQTRLMKEEGYLIEGDENTTKEEV